MVHDRKNGASELQRIVRELYSGDPPRDVVASFIKEKRRAVLFEVLAEESNPAVVFGERFLEICAEAGIDPEDLKSIR